MRVAVGGRAIPYSHDDRNALALLMLPFLIVALSLAINQGMRKSGRNLAPMLEPSPIADARVPIVAPSFTPPGRIAYPEQAPAIDVASLEVRTPPISLPTAAPVIELPPPALRIPPPAIAWPLLPPRIEAGPAEVGPAPAPATSAAHNAAGNETGVCVPEPKSLAPRLASLGGGTGLTRVNPAEFGVRLAAAARAQTSEFVIYSARYQRIAYPMGDVSPLAGACSDVVIRAYRALGIDLQELVQRAHVGSGDPNIDHRRTNTLRALFAREAASVAISAFPEDYKPGDIVTYYRPFSRVSRAHIAIVSDVLAPSGRPMIVHNRGWGPQLEDALFVDRMTGHYRYAGPSPVLAEKAPRNSTLAALRARQALIRSLATPDRAAAPRAGPITAKLIPVALTTTARSGLGMPPPPKVK